MPLAPGSRLGPYQVTATLGAGGMGEVYRARDTRLGRDVAIKVLPQHLSADAARRERFEREARVVSNLNHPHICTLYDVGTQETAQGTVDYLVMEHIEGDTLADRLAKGPLPVEQTLRTAMEIADALDKAHRQGVIHRDLKPANVMLTRSGAKLLDFGLAKLIEGRGSAQGERAGAGGAAGGSAAGPGAGGSLLATATGDLTTAGSLLGTFQYMAPEQLEGREADARTDIFAFGLLVYEMATGRRAFEGRSQASLIAAILKEQPRPIAEWQPLSPAGLDRVVRACLAKDPDDRVQTAHDVRMQLGWVADGSLSDAARGATGAAAGGASGVSSGAGPASTGAGPAPARRAGAELARSGRGLSPGIATLLILAFGAAGAAIGWWMHAAPRAPGLHVNIQLPPKTLLDLQNTALALSPDGRFLAYAGSGSDGLQRIWVRPLDGLEAQPLPGTENGTYPFWAPDGKSIGFFADQKLKRIPASGGTVQTVCGAPDGRGASWSAAGMIAFAPAPFGGLAVVPAAGGTPTPLTQPEGDGTTHRLPRFLPDGRRLLFLASTAKKDAVNGIHALDLDTKAITLVAKENSGAIFVPPDTLAFVREGNLMAQRFDPKSLRVTGEAVPIAEKVLFNPNRWTGAFSFSDTGLLVYLSGAGIARARLTWFDVEGKELEAIGEPASIVEVALSPDMRRAAATVLGPTGVPNVWIYDLARGVGSRFVFEGDNSSSPVWSPDGRQIAYVDTENRISVKPADGATAARVLLAPTGPNRLLTQWIPDGSALLYWQQGPKNGDDVFLLPLAGGEPHPILAAAANERDALVSPDGRWLLYNSDESGRTEAYVVSYPGRGGKWQVSPAGALAGSAAWGYGGRRVLYVDPSGKPQGVDFSVANGNPTIGAPRPVFGGRTFFGPAALTPDGQRLLMAQPAEQSALSSLVLITDWSASLAR